MAGLAAAAVAILGASLAGTASAAGWSSSTAASGMTISTYTMVAPGAPGTTANCSGNGNNTAYTVTVTWPQTTSTRATGYTIWKATVSGGPYTQIGSTSGLAATTFTDTGSVIANGISPSTANRTNYYYVIQAIWSGGTTWASPNSGQTTFAAPAKNCA